MIIVYSFTTLSIIVADQRTVVRAAEPNLARLLSFLLVDRQG